MRWVSTSHDLSEVNVLLAEIHRNGFVATYRTSLYKFIYEFSMYDRVDMVHLRFEFDGAESQIYLEKPSVRSIIESISRDVDPDHNVFEPLMRPAVLVWRDTYGKHDSMLCAFRPRGSLGVWNSKQYKVAFLRPETIGYLLALKTSVSMASNWSLYQADDALIAHNVRSEAHVQQLFFVDSEVASAVLASLLRSKQVGLQCVTPVRNMIAPAYEAEVSVLLRTAKK